MKNDFFIEIGEDRIIRMGGRFKAGQVKEHFEKLGTSSSRLQNELNTRRRC